MTTKNKTSNIKTAKLTDAQEMKVLHPDTFYAPSEEELSMLRVGDTVKICAESSKPKEDDCSERFWVEITEIHDQNCVGRIDNDLVNTDLHGLDCDDLVHFTKRHVYNIFPRQKEGG